MRLGQSKIERFYAFVETKEGDLGEQLVRNGLARSTASKPPRRELTSSRIEVEKLQQLEDEAKRDKVGAWGVTRTNACRTLASVLLLPMERSVTLGTCGLAFDFLRLPKQAASITRSSPVERNGSHAKEKIPLGNIDINTATEKELTTVPGIGHVMAARIIAARPFRSADDLKRVSGIGEKKYAQIRPYFQ